MTDRSRFWPAQFMNVVIPGSGWLISPLQRKMTGLQILAAWVLLAGLFLLLNPFLLLILPILIFSALSEFSQEWDGQFGKRQKKTPNNLVNNLMYVLGFAVVFYGFFYLLAIVLRYVPEPIGSRADLFVEGARVTLTLTIVAGAIGLAIGVLLGLMRLSRLWIARAPASFVVWIIRGTPLLVQLLFVYNALPQILKAVGLDFQLNEFYSAVLALAVNVGAYNAEVIRAGVQAVPRGQNEAARSLGLGSLTTMSFVVMPQALRIVLPPLVNNLIALLKDSSLAFVIALPEVTTIASRISSETFLPIPTLTTLAVVYLALTTVLTFFTNILETRLRLSSR
ncbi:amino acid ABC transporter permease [Deinococcus peraridilitoris]|uniref:Amine acid ABC transporter, permease protein, 3-TM region, His/Glu/Gln/Arg/opine family n=1 Tax=Deinococcus peraridilitoris (strain DSM 19664 / LMG 22246 / CIP 109416 / KR-200) TaxID=937777 RepID=L0A6I6_DEIPD|nr:amine acid ABC transporter, permease protein, 3-TM region, His/Glu/Gln/Arg/opine family [Deinococcus peraridilitoris DSM 19664]